MTDSWWHKLMLHWRYPMFEHECKLCGDTFYTSEPSARFCTGCATVYRLVMAVRNAIFDICHPGWSKAVA